MAMIEAETGPGKELGGNGRKIRRGKSGSGENRLTRVPVGYIRGKKVSGHRYYFYCEAVKQPDGSFKEQCEYLGSARSIRDNMRSKVVKTSAANRAKGRVSGVG